MRHATLLPFKGDGAVDSVDCSIERHGDRLFARWRVAAAPEALVLPVSARPERRDGLWQTTCFELFLAWGSPGYLELNAAPSGDWAAYRFTDYRNGMTPAALNAPVMALRCENAAVTVDVTVRLPAEIAAVPLDLGVAAVIENMDGDLDHWALAHPADRPDFHDPSCFRLRLPAAD